MKIKHVLFSMILASASVIASAQSPFDGTWAMNQSKSQLAGDTMTFASASDGMLKYTDSVQSYTFKPDGTEFKTPLGRERTFKMVNPTTYETTTKMNGAVIGSSTWKLSIQDRRLTIDFKEIKANGETSHDTAVYERIAGNSGAGLVGKWKSKQVQIGSPDTLTIASSGADNVTFSIASQKITCNGKWDGNEYPITGPNVPSGLTLTFHKEGSKAFTAVQKLNGKEIQIEEYKISADGKVLNTKGHDAQGKEPYSIVWERKAEVASLAIRSPRTTGGFFVFRRVAGGPP